MTGISVVRQYEEGVVFRLGRLRKVKHPGLRVVIPIIDRMRKVSMRTVTMPIQSQQIITRDSVSIGVAAVAYFRRVDAAKSIISIENVRSAIYEIAQTTVRNIVGRSTLDHVLSETETLNAQIQQVLDHTAERWGVVVEMVELKDIELPESMKRAMAREETPRSCSRPSSWRRSAPCSSSSRARSGQPTSSADGPISPSAPKFSRSVRHRGEAAA